MAMTMTTSPWHYGMSKSARVQHARNPAAALQFSPWRAKRATLMPSRALPRADSDKQAQVVQACQDADRKAPALNEAQILADLQSQEQKTSFWFILKSTLRMAAMVGVAAVLLLGNTNPAYAARSGGRMGGSAGFSSGRSASSSSHSSGGYSGGSRLGTSGYGRSSGLSSSYHTTIITPPSIYSTPLPMYSSPSVVVAPRTSAVVYGGSSFAETLFFFAVVGVFLMVLMAPSVIRSSGSSDSSFSTGVSSPPVTVAKVQVCMLANARQLKQELDALGDVANTSTQQGLHNMLQEVVLALLRYPEYCVSAATTSSNEKNAEKGEAAFNQMSLEERSHFKLETLINSAGRAVKKMRLSGESKDVSELMVVTIMVAGNGSWSLPTIRNMSDLKEALRKLGSLTSNQLLAAEITWTPQADNDSLTQQEVMVEYPNLVNL